MRLKAVLLLVLALSIAAAVAAYHAATKPLFEPPTLERETEEYVSVGSRLPSFAGRTLAGEPFDSRELKGHVTLINLWATWCGPCIAEMPRIEEEIWRAFGGEVRVVGVARGEDPATIQRFNANAKLTFPLMPDPDESVFRLFASDSIPRNYVIDRDGRITYVSLGYSEQHFEELLDAIHDTL